jgi:two-component system sensor histidine kinase QseC
VKRRFENLQASAIKMERMLEGLLDLSRIDSGIIQVRPTETDIAKLVDTCWERVCRAGGDSGHTLENSIYGALQLNTDPVLLEQIMLNLLSNAVCYSPPGSAVVCKSRRTSSGVWELSISNHSETLDPGDLCHIFERFWRKDAARTEGRHSGLGLSIVHALAEVLDIRISADLTDESLFVVRLQFPAQVNV